MHKKLLHIACLFLLAGMMCSCKGLRKELPDLRERYGLTDTKPFGAYTAFRMLAHIYPEKPITTTQKSFSQFYKQTRIDSASLYINISNKYFASDADAQSLLDFVYDGNTAFIAASQIDSNLLGKIYCRQANSDFLNMLAPTKYRSSAVSLLPDDYSSQDSFGYYYRPFSDYFSEIHEDRARIAGYNDEGKPNFIVFFWGEGRLFLHSSPRAFSNYFLLTENNHLYLKQIMQIVIAKPDKVFYDNYYNKKNFRENNDRSFSALSEILKHPALAIAFFITVCLLLLYVFFGGKRKQRIVPVVEPVTNTSIAFTEAVAGLYLLEKNNKNIADKMISYFSEFIRTRYFLHLHSTNKDFTAALSKKSGVEAEHVQALYNTIEQVALAQEVSDFELLTLNEQIQQFYKQRN